VILVFSTIATRIRQPFPSFAHLAQARAACKPILPVADFACRRFCPPLALANPAAK
jgi:hypothetical protein